MKPNDFLFDMGTAVRDSVTGIEGFVTGRTQWLTGCNTIGVNRGVDKDGDEKDLFWVDETRCEALDTDPLRLPGEEQAEAEAPEPDRGGPQETPRQTRG